MAVGVWGDLEAYWANIVLGDPVASEEEPPDPPDIGTGLVTLYRNPAHTGAAAFRTRGLAADLIVSGPSTIVVTQHEAELYRLFTLNGQRVFSYQPWS
jgi:hypothetical protein